MRRTLDRRQGADLSLLLADAAKRSGRTLASSAPENEGFASVMAAVRELHPAYFALVMATGIVSIAAHLSGMAQVATALLWLNVVAYCTLWLLNVARLTWFHGRFFSDLFDHQVGPGFFTAVAATSVLGSQLTLVAESHGAAILLWGLALLLWLGLIYAIFVGLTIKETKPPIDRGINGGWLIAIVATQSVAVLGGLLSSHLEPYRAAVLFLALVMWLFGGMLYIWIISLIFYRYTFFRFSPEDLTPPYWVNMGAVAISTLGGTILIRHAGEVAFLGDVLPFLRGLTLLFWATGTWWIPMLILLGIWRHMYRKFPFVYSPLYWGAVFPLGMYAVSTYGLAEVNDLPFLLPIPRFFVYIALCAWLIVFGGLVGAARRALVASLRSSRAPVPTPLYGASKPRQASQSPE